MNQTILQWNVRSFSTNRVHILDAIDTLQPKILSLKETRFLKTSRINLPGYQPPTLYSRPKGTEGGVAIYVHSTISFSSISLDTPLEAVAATVYYPQKRFTICSLYLPPTDNNGTLMTALTDLVTQLPKPFLIPTDANAHHPDWGSPMLEATCSPTGLKKRL